MHPGGPRWIRFRAPRRHLQGTSPTLRGAKLPGPCSDTPNSGEMALDEATVRSPDPRDPYRNLLSLAFRVEVSCHPGGCWRRIPARLCSQGATGREVGVSDHLRGVALVASVGAVVGSPSPRRVRERAQNDGKRREALIAETSGGTRVFGGWPRSAKPPDLAWHATADHVRQRSNEDREGEWSDRVQVIAGSLQPAIGLLG